VSDGFQVWWTAGFGATLSGREQHFPVDWDFDRGFDADAVLIGLGCDDGDADVVAWRQ
jgi:hypothetical protein